MAKRQPPSTYRIRFRDRPSEWRSTMQDRWSASMKRKKASRGDSSTRQDRPRKSSSRRLGGSVPPLRRLTLSAPRSALQLFLDPNPPVVGLSSSAIVASGVALETGEEVDHQIEGNCGEENPQSHAW